MYYQGTLAILNLHRYASLEDAAHKIMGGVFKNYNNRNQEGLKQYVIGFNDQLALKAKLGFQQDADVEKNYGIITNYTVLVAEQYFTNYLKGVVKCGRIDANGADSPVYLIELKWSNMNNGSNYDWKLEALQHFASARF
uniref:Type II restriction endonuclease n=1 Tax=Caenorhabditis tropicalis TaxID=1561998 RepID=A0A1I7TRV7_9PELO